MLLKARFRRQVCVHVVIATCGSNPGVHRRWMLGRYGPCSGILLRLEEEENVGDPEGMLGEMCRAQKDKYCTILL